MWQHGSKYFACRPLPPDPYGQKVKIQPFRDMVMLHIKFIGIRKCSNMVANILPSDPHPPPPHLTQGVKRSKFNFFRTMSCCISKLKGITNAATWSQIFYLQTREPGDGFNRSKVNFFRRWSCCLWQFHNKVHIRELSLLQWLFYVF